MKKLIFIRETSFLQSDLSGSQKQVEQSRLRQRIGGLICQLFGWYPVITLGVLFCLLPFLGQSQTSCTKQLKAAQKLYDEGLIEKVPELLWDCINSKGFTSEQKIQAYRLLILAAIYEDKISLADELMETFLKIEPEYEIDEAVDPIEFIDLLHSYRTLPVYSLGLGAGLNFTFIQTLERFGTHTLLEDNIDVFGSKLGGFQVGPRFNRFINKRLSVELGANFMTVTQNTSTNYTDYKLLTQTETQSLINIPLSFNYEFFQKKLRPFVRLGGGMDLLLSSEVVSNLEITNLNGSSANREGTAINNKDLRKPNRFFAMGGLGVKYKIRKGYLTLGVDLYYGLNNVVEPENRYSNPELIWNYEYIDNDFMMNNLLFSVGYYKSFYNPKKRRYKEKHKIVEVNITPEEE